MILMCLCSESHLFYIEDRIAVSSIGATIYPGASKPVGRTCLRTCIASARAAAVRAPRGTCGCPDDGATIRASRCSPSSPDRRPISCPQPAALHCTSSHWSSSCRHSQNRRSGLRSTRRAGTPRTRAPQISPCARSPPRSDSTRKIGASSSSGDSPRLWVCISGMASRARTPAYSGRARRQARN